MFDSQGLIFCPKTLAYPGYHILLEAERNEMKTTIPKILELDGKKHNKHSQNYGSVRIQSVSKKLLIQLWAHQL